jgi:hypothetical protein
MRRRAFALTLPEPPTESFDRMRRLVQVLIGDAPATFPPGVVGDTVHSGGAFRQALPATTTD